jgi:hypothetical protein
MLNVYKRTKRIEGKLLVRIAVGLALIGVIELGTCSWLIGLFKLRGDKGCSCFILGYYRRSRTLIGRSFSCQVRKHTLFMNFIYYHLSEKFRDH